MIELRHKDQTKVLRGLIYQVRNELGGGWSEEVYHKAMIEVLQIREIPFVSKPRRPFLHRDIEVHLFEPDLVIWDLIILELKALPYQRNFIGQQFAQLIHYLKFWKMDLGLLVNFGRPKVDIERVIWDENPWDISEDYDEIRPYLSQQDKVYLRQIRHNILELAKTYGMGFPETMYRKLLTIEAEFNNLPCINEVIVTATWNGKEIAHHTTQYLCLAGHYLVHIRSLLEFPTAYDFTSTKTYLKNLGLNFGFVVNFGKQKLQIYGVKSD